jgi:hypothetical protein
MNGGPGVEPGQQPIPPFARPGTRLVPPSARSERRAKSPFGIAFSLGSPRFWGLKKLGGIYYFKPRACILHSFSLTDPPRGI